MRVVSALLLACALASPAAAAKDVYLEPDAFLDRAFDGEPPEPGAIWLAGDTREVVESILGHDYRGARIRYWRRGERTAWILEEIGKHEPITTGLIVDAGEIARIRVLIYRESRGWEVRQRFFTRQFKGASLDEDRGLDTEIDGISGATLSVRALTNLARVSLYLHQRAVREP